MCYFVLSRAALSDSHLTEKSKKKSEIKAVEVKEQEAKEGDKERVVDFKKPSKKGKGKEKGEGPNLGNEDDKTKKGKSPE